MPYMLQLATVCSLVFFAGFVDSIAGGGGIIALPAYLLAGLPPTVARGSVKFTSTVGLIVVSFRFWRRGLVHIWVALTAAAAALAGSAIGTELGILLDEHNERIFHFILIGSLPLLAAFILLNKRIGTDKPNIDLRRPRTYILSALAGFVIGAYDGFFGPGAGTFLIIALNALVGLNVLTASGTAKVINLASNISALLVHFINGSVFLRLALPAAAFSILGNILGSRLAFKNGARLIRPAFVVVLGLLLIKISYDVFIAGS